MQRLGISPEHKRQLQQQSAAHKRRIAANGTAVRPRVSPAVVDEVLSQLDLGQQTKRPAEKRPALPAPAHTPQRKPPTKQERIRATHARKRRALLASLPKQSWDIRAMIAAEEWLAQWVVRGTHFYVDARSFIVAHSAGCCSFAEGELRREKCSTCDSAYTRKGHGYCASCDCGEWPPSHRTHQTGLANFACPKKKFGRAHGWIPRLLHWSRLRRRSSDRR